MQPIVLRLNPETRYRLEILSRTTRVSRETLVAEAVRRFVDEQLLAIAEAQAGQKIASAPECDDSGVPVPETWKIIV